MIFAFTIAALGLWILTKEKPYWGTFMRMLFWAGIVATVWDHVIVQQNITTGLLTLSVLSLLLAVTGYVTDMYGGGTYGKIMFIIIASAMGYFVDQKLKSYPSENTGEVLKPDSAGELLAEVPPAGVSVIKSICRTYGATVKSAFSPVSPQSTVLDDYLIIDVPDGNDTKDLLEKLKASEYVRWVEYNEVIPMKFPAPAKDGIPVVPLSNDPSVSMQWHLSYMNMGEYYKAFETYGIKPERPARLYILDTGIDSRHEDLPSSATNKPDKQGHGTHCAGVAAAITNNRLGVASMSPGKDWIEVYGIQVIGDVGFGTQKSIIDGIILAADQGADVISMSLGGITNQEREKTYNEAVKYANSKGSIVVVAAGNANLDAARYSPANSENVITVASVNENLAKSGFSNHLQNITLGISAPGERILSTTPGNTYTAYNGTSMSTPQVAGLIAVMKAIRPALDTYGAYKILERTGTETTGGKRSGKMIQPSKAIIDLTQSN